MACKRLIVAVISAIAVAVALPGPPASAGEWTSSIVNLSSWRCLDATAQWGGVNGTPIQLWDCYGPGQTNQRWISRSVTGGYQIINVASGRCLDAPAQWNGVRGTPLQLWDCYGAGQLNQIWQMYIDEQRNVVIKSVLYGRVLDAKWEQIASNGTPVQLWDDWGYTKLNQRWRHNF